MSAKRRWTRRIAIAAGFFLATYALVWAAFWVWIAAETPPDAPRIALSLDDTWLNDVGITRSTYDQALARAGGRLVTFEPDDVPAEPQAIRNLLETQRIDAVLLTGGGDVDPALYGGEPDKGFLVNRPRDDFEIALIRQARELGLPILGICRGCQILNVALGGTVRNLRDDGPLSGTHFTFSGHAVTLEEDSRLAAILGVTRLDNVYSFHGQAADQPGDGVHVAARAADGVVEAIEAGDLSGRSRTDPWILAVQWHPEMAVTNVTQNRLFNAFVEQARNRRARRAGSATDN